MNDEMMAMQIKLAYLEQQSDDLNAVIIAQDRRIKDLEDQIRLLYRYLDSKEDKAIAQFDLLADRPPHY